MSHRRPDPRQAHLENVLRNALRLAADSVEPAADGLDRIRAKISTRQPVQPGWTTTTPAGVLAALWRRIEPAVIWLRYMIGAVVERFRPDSGRAGRLGWLRPAAAVATGLFVVAAASWAITALPQVIAPTTNTSHYGGSGGGGSSAHRHSSSAGTQSNPGGGVGPATSSSPTPSPSCRSGSAPASSSASPSHTHSSSASPTTSPSPSSSPSPSPSPSGSSSGSPSPSGSPSASVPSNSPAAVASRASSSGTPGRATSALPRSSSPMAVSSPATHVSRSRCG